MLLRRGYLVRWALALVMAITASCSQGGGATRVPPGYPASYAETIAAGEEEGQVVVWSTTDLAIVADLLAGFRHRYPKIVVEYREMRASNIFDWFLARQSRGALPDLLWSSAMDLQIKLVNDGYAQTYASPEREAIASWANWKDQAWGITAEPIVLLYNRRFIDPGEAPRSHVQFRSLLEGSGGRLAGRVASYDPTQSAFGYLILSQDDMASPDVWQTVSALGATRARMFPTSKAIIADVAEGRSWLGYNVLGSYAADAARRNPDLAVVVPSDYTLVASRIAIIPAAAVHSNAAKLFLDYLLSRPGQEALAKHVVPSVRADVPAPAGLRDDGTSVRAIRVGPALLVLQDALTQRQFMRRWEQALAAGRNEGAQPAAR